RSLYPATGAGPFAPRDRCAHGRHRKNREAPSGRCRPRARRHHLWRTRQCEEAAMSDSAHIAEPESAVRIEERAAEWLLSRQDARNWSDENQSELDAWLGQSFAHQVAFYRLEATLDRAERLRALGPSLR